MHLVIGPCTLHTKLLQKLLPIYKTFEKTVAVVKKCCNVYGRKLRFIAVSCLVCEGLPMSRWCLHVQWELGQLYKCDTFVLLHLSARDPEYCLIKATQTHLWVKTWVSISKSIWFILCLLTNSLLWTLILAATCAQPLIYVICIMNYWTLHNSVM